MDYLRKEEIKRMSLFALAMRYQQDMTSQDPVSLELLLEITRSNTTVPVIITDQDGKPLGREMMKNIPPEIMGNPKRLDKYLSEMKSGYPPFEIELSTGNQLVYFMNSSLLNSLRYTPIWLGLIVLAYALFTYWFFAIMKKTDEGYLWAGLAKETAHQIGTPLSSMMGWVEMLKLEHENSPGLVEIEKDINRLGTISERFSKIGSRPELLELNLSETIAQNYSYLKKRISSKVDFTLDMPEAPILIPHNQILIGWVMENLVKNAVDAMRGEGKLSITLEERKTGIILDFTDTGSGMAAHVSRRIFNPGFSTKQRGWGLGLSLAKRAVHDYHKGEIKVVESVVGKGTTIRIFLPK